MYVVDKRISRLLYWGNSYKYTLGCTKHIILCTKFLNKFEADAKIKIQTKKDIFLLNRKSLILSEFPSLKIHRNYNRYKVYETMSESDA